MNITNSHNLQASSFNSVIALHCAGGSPGQWEELGFRLDSSYWLHTPSHIGSEANNAWDNKRPFTLADEAVQSLRLIDKTDAAIHLVGHSYGGALALHIALARPHRIASVTIYEPCAFHLLAQSGSASASENWEIQKLSRYIAERLSCGDNTAAMSRFVDYWSGPGVWEALKPEKQEVLKRWAPTANLEFEAIINEKADADMCRKLTMPIKILQGTQSPTPVKAVASSLENLLPHCTVEQLTDLGHMGPITHGSYVAGLIADHIHARRSHKLSESQAA